MGLARDRQHIGVLAGVMLLLLLGVVVLALLPPNARTAPAAALDGPFPSELGNGDLVYHTKQVTLTPDTPHTMYLESWFRPSNGHFREEAGRNEGILEVKTFDGDQFRGFDTESHRAWQFSTARLAELGSEELYPTDAGWNKPSFFAQKVRETVEAGKFDSVTSGMMQDRAITEYTGGGPLSPFDKSRISRLVVDNQTGLPLVRIVSNEKDQVVQEDYWDYELVTVTPGLFDAVIPPDYIAETDDDLPLAPGADRVSLSEVATDAPFQLYSLGEAFDGLPLDYASLPSKDGVVKIVYRYPFTDPRARETEFRQLLLYEFDQKATPDFAQSMMTQLSEPQDANVEGLQASLYRDQSTGGPAAIVIRGATTILIIQALGDPNLDLTQASSSLVEVQR